MFLSLLKINVGDDPRFEQPGRKWLGNLYRVHQRLWMAFPHAESKREDPFFLGPWQPPADPKPPRSERGFLYRIERDGSPRILVQSIEKPDWEYAFHNAPYLLAADPKVRSFDPAPEAGEVFRFRLIANVVGRVAKNYADGRQRETKAGKVVARRRREERRILPAPLPKPLSADNEEREAAINARWKPWREWLSTVGSKSGFELAGDAHQPLFMERVHVAFTRTSDEGAEVVSQKFNAGRFEGFLRCTSPEKLAHTLVRGIGSGKAFGLGLLSLAPR